LVTGATGFVGWHVARLLMERGHNVRALTRSGGPIKDLEVELVKGDLRDSASMDRAAAGCSLVFHVAADYRLWTRNPREMYESNVDGTRNLLASAKKAAVDRVVYTSTVGCVGFVKDGLGDEQSRVGIEDMAGHYKRSKFMAERVALEFAAGGLPVVIVNPTAPVGDHDVKPTPTGKIIVDFLKGAMPAFLNTGLNLVDVRDVAMGHWLACEHGAPGERYILGCQNLTLQQIFQSLEKLSGIKAPRVRIPYPVAYAAGLLSSALAEVTGREPRAPIEGVRMARKRMFVSHAKAERDLHYNPGPVEGALARAAEWFRGNGYC
jgi:dihydroflavonol-4-reductase